MLTSAVSSTPLSADCGRREVVRGMSTCGVVAHLVRARRTCAPPSVVPSLRPCHCSHDGSGKLLHVTSSSACPSRECAASGIERDISSSSFHGCHDVLFEASEGQVHDILGANGRQDFHSLLLLHDVHKKDAQRDSLHCLGPQAALVFHCVSACSWHQPSRLACPSATLVTLQAIARHEDNSVLPLRVIKRTRSSSSE